MADGDAPKGLVSRNERKATELTWLDIFRANLLAPPLSEEEAMRLAVEEVRAMRRERD